MTLSYTVQSGDTWASLATDKKTSVALLQRMNPKVSEPLIAGTKVSVPGRLNAAAHAPTATNTSGTPPGVPVLYLLVDGTDAVDSAAFGGALEASFPGLFKNIAEESFGGQEDPAADAAGEYVSLLLDQDNLMLPIWRTHDQPTRKDVAVVMPAGKDGVSADGAWASPQKRKTLADANATLMQTLLRQPQTAMLATSSPKQGFGSTAADMAAELVQVSSHGWLGGFMRGNGPDAMATGDPSGSDWSVSPPYFAVGSAAVAGVGFHGPKWIVLAQCSTVNDATWSLWAQVLANSSPGVRGILAYEFAAPAAAQAAGLARSFIHNAKTMTILDAWWKANAGVNWAAVIHKSALGDKLGDWRSFAPLTDVTTTATTSNYMGFITDPAHLGAKPTARPIVIMPDPFTLKLVHSRGTASKEITPANLDANAAAYFVGDVYTVTVTAPASSTLSSATLTWIHIRATFKDQFDAKAIFEIAPVTPGATVNVTTGAAPTSVVVTPSTPTASLAVSFTAKAAAAGMEPHHSYLWLRCQIAVTGGATTTFEFRTKGLIYYG